MKARPSRQCNAAVWCSPHVRCHAELIASRPREWCGGTLGLDGFAASSMLGERLPSWRSLRVVQALGKVLTLAFAFDLWRAEVLQGGWRGVLRYLSSGGVAKGEGRDETGVSAVLYRSRGLLHVVLSQCLLSKNHNTLGC